MAKAKTKKKTASNPLKDIKHHHVLLGAIAIAGLILLALYGLQSKAASDRYVFTARGVVTARDTDLKTLNISVTHLDTEKAKDDLLGVNQVFYTPTGKFYKNAAGKDQRITFTNIAIGQEVGFKGVSKTDGKFNITWLRVNDRSFTVVGTIKDVNRTNKTYTVEISSTTYRAGSYKGKNVIMNYGNNSVFTSGGNEVNADDVKAGDKKIKVTGTVTDFNKWEISKLVDNYSGN